MTKSLIVLFGILFGIPAGLGTFTFYYADGTAYLSNKPQACINCHVMQGQYNSWIKSSHHGAAVCNDCHTPGNIAQKYLAKASNGFWHSWAFTTGRFMEPIQIKPHNRRLVETSCKSCHQSFLAGSMLIQHKTEGISCTRCHSEVGHNR